MAKKYIELEAAIKALQPTHAPAINEVLASVLRRVPAADVVEVVRCAECVHRPTGTGVNHDVHFPSCDFTCPCHCDDSYYSWIPKDNWFCANGKRKDGGQGGSSDQDPQKEET